MLLVTYGTGSGYTREVAEWIADELRQAGREVDLLDVADDPEPGVYTGVLVGSGIRASKWHKAASEWLRRHRATLATMPVATFTCSLQAAEESQIPTVDAYSTKLLEDLGLRAVTHASLPGAYDPSRFSRAERLVMKALRQGATVDHRDEERTRAWARECAALLPA